jgi:hypothetical protein
VKNIVLCQPLALPALESVLNNLKQSWLPDSTLTLWSTQPCVEQLGFRPDESYDRAFLITAPPDDLEWMQNPTNWHVDALLSDVF